MQHLPIILIELVLVFGGVLAFAWWQLRSVKQDRLKAAERRAAELNAAKPDSEQTNGDELPETNSKERKDST